VIDLDIRSFFDTLDHGLVMWAVLMSSEKTNVAFRVLVRRRGRRMRVAAAGDGEAEHIAPRTRSRRGALRLR
jgi:hypothetical protein